MWLSFLKTDIEESYSFIGEGGDSFSTHEKITHIHTHANTRTSAHTHTHTLFLLYLTDEETSIYEI